MRFEYYHEPATVGECIEQLTHYGEEASLLAGGTDLVPRLRARTVRPRAVISLGALAELSKLERNGDGSVEIGAMATLRDVERSEILGNEFNIIRQGAGCVSCVHIRNVATLGGNSCNASPSADTVPGLIAAGAVVRIAGPTGERTLPLEDFFEGPEKTALQRGEILVGFHVPAPPPDTGGCYKKYAIRGEVDLAIVGVAASLTLDENRRVRRARIVLGAVAPTPIRAHGAEELLIGRLPDEKTIGEAGIAAAEDSEPITDQRATAQYRREMIRVWTRHAVRQAYQEALGRKRG